MKLTLILTNYIDNNEGCYLMIYSVTFSVDLGALQSWKTGGGGSNQNNSSRRLSHQSSSSTLSGNNTSSQIVHDNY